MKKYLPYLSVLFFISFFSCNHVSPTESAEDQVVVDAFIYANTPVKNISLTHPLSLGSTDTIGEPVTDAEVIILKNNVSYHLLYDPENASYYYPGNDLIIENGNQLELNINYKSRRIYAETSIPAKPAGLSLNYQTYTVPDFSQFDPRNNNKDTTRKSIIASWTNDNEGYYYVVIESAEENPEKIDTSSGNRRFGMRFISSPFISSSYQISFSSISYYGKNRLVLYKVNKEYADLYESRTQDSRNLNEPLSNINNGLGVFSGFSSDTTYFDVLKE
jgi:hypothetical protein